MLGVRGQFHLTVDGKGRLSLPSKLRDALKGRGEETLVFTNFKGSIWGYTEDVWSRYEAQLLDVSPFEDESLLFTRAFIAGASECSFDKQGRVLLPSYLRDYAGLGKEAVIISVVDRLEIWSRERWEEAYQVAVSALDQGGGLGGLKFGRRREP